MRVGDIDGRNVIYRLTAAKTNYGRVTNFSGAIILKPRERLLFFEKDLRPEMWTAGRGRDRFYDQLYPRGDGLLTIFRPMHGWGTMYFTDRRILFLRRPDIDQLKETIGGRGGPDSRVIIPQGAASRARRIAWGGGMEFFEIMYEDILRCQYTTRSAQIWFRKSQDAECVIRLTRKLFDGIAPMLEARGVPVARRVAFASQLPLFRMSLVALVGALSLMWLLGGDEIYKVLAIMVGLFSAILIVLISGATPKLDRVKSLKWESGKAHRLGKGAAYTIAGIFFAAGIVGSILMGSIAPIIFTLLCGGVFLITGIVLSRDWTKISHDRHAMSYEYDCPSCGFELTRREIACGQCGAGVWWVQGDRTRTSR